MIEAASAGRGKGAEFMLRLPLRRGTRGGSSARRQGWSAMTQKRVLVVDDNRDAADSLGTAARAPRRRRARCTTLARRSRPSKHRPGVVLLDIGMPDLDGYQVARAIRGAASTAGAPLVALTGWGQEEDRRRVRKRGSYHLVKPPISARCGRSRLRCESARRPPSTARRRLPRGAARRASSPTTATG